MNNKLSFYTKLFFFNQNFFFKFKQNKQLKKRLILIYIYYEITNKK